MNKTTVPINEAFFQSLENQLKSLRDSLEMLPDCYGRSNILYSIDDCLSDLDFYFSRSI